MNITHSRRHDTVLPLALHLATSMQIITGCQVVFEPLGNQSGCYMFEPNAEDTFLIISTQPLIEGRFFEVWQTLLELASYHLAIPPGDFRRLYHIEATYKDGQLAAPYLEELNLDNTYAFLCATLTQQAGICPLGFCDYLSKTIHQDRQRFWTVYQNASFKSAVPGHTYRLIS